MDDGYANRDADWMARTAKDVTAKDLADAAYAKAESEKRHAATCPWCIDDGTSYGEDGHAPGSHESSWKALELGVNDILPGAAAGQLRIASNSGMRIVCRQGDRQHPADRLDPVDIAMFINEHNYLRNGCQERWRAPPTQNKPTPSSRYRWQHEALGSRAQAV